MVKKTDRLPKKSKKFLNIVSGMTTEKGNPRVKKIVHRIVTDLFKTIEDLDIQPDEFWIGGRLFQ